MIIIIIIMIIIFLPFPIWLIPFLSPHLIWSKGHTRCARTSSKGRQSCVITHAFTTVLHSLLSCTIILPYSTAILLSFNSLFTPSILPVRGLPLNLTPLTLDSTILFTNRFCSARPANSLVTPVLLRTSHLAPPHFSLGPYELLHTYPADTSSTLHLISSPLLPYSMFQVVQLLLTLIPITL